MSCGKAVESASGCGITIRKPNPLSGNQCIELVVLTVSQACPVAPNTSVLLRFDVHARTNRPGLRWRRAEGNPDVLDPSSGALSGDGVSTVVVNDIVLGPELKIEIVDGETVLMNFRLRHE